ncbi:hypothetical protein GSI_09881 [Ganoderma sinense ZZ0214-1]|uniref:Uncharacterized protein n=1 Tax=Ganoderma sinense ZZ0214-1 TaxID=1077348 RepID=A0A2G8S2M9_9APHY|nr:hypothetical protein GSI_09881 [Ganoderma sinense ZZ0214-1]
MRIICPDPDASPESGIGFVEIGRDRRGDGARNQGAEHGAGSAESSRSRNGSRVFNQGRDVDVGPRRRGFEGSQKTGRRDDRFRVGVDSKTTAGSCEREWSSAS